MWALLCVVAVTGAVAAAAALASPKAAPSLVIWTDANHAAAVSKVADSWAASTGASIQVVTKDFGSIPTALTNVAATDAPDVILAAHYWTGQLAAAGLVEPLSPTTAVAAQFRKPTLDGFSYGTAVKKLYGIPVQVENIGLLVNTKLAKVPTTFAALEANALTWNRKHHVPFGLCVQQGPDGDAYHMTPFFFGLGGYVFGTNSAGSLDPKRSGIANPTFLKNAHLIDRWNKEGLINSAADYSTCDTAFTQGRTPYWITGPWAVSDIQKAGIAFKVVQLPAIVKPSVPFLGIDGFMVTKFAAGHSVDAAAKDLVLNGFSAPVAQTQIAAAGDDPPANVKAKAASSVLAQFARAGKGGVPIPNIPQMNSVWSDLGAAWVRSTKGTGAMQAARSFRGAARSIAFKTG